MKAAPPVPISELLLEYQHYVVAYRLRSVLGGHLTPHGPALKLSEYSLIRNERQALARQMISRGCPPGTLAKLETLTDRLLFGFWHNPSQMADFIRAAVRQGGHPALEDPAAFAALLSVSERSRLGERGLGRVIRHYHACLDLAGLFTSPHGFDAAWARVEAERVPLFIDELSADAPPARS